MIQEAVKPIKSLPSSLAKLNSITLFDLQVGAATMDPREMANRK
jgi:hypothetical protein